MSKILKYAALVANDRETKQDAYEFPEQQITVGMMRSQNVLAPN